MSSHDLSELEQICNWLVLIDSGRSLYQGPTSELLGGVEGGLAVAAQRPQDEPALRQLIVEWGHRFRLESDRLVVATNGADVGDLAAELNRAAFDAGIVLIELSPLRRSLEDRYLTMMQEGVR